MYETQEGRTVRSVLTITKTPTPGKPGEFEWFTGIKFHDGDGISLGDDKFTDAMAILIKQFIEGPDDDTPGDESKVSESVWW